MEMKTQQFKLHHCLFAPEQYKDNTRTAKYLVPTLPAYAIGYAELIVPPDLDGAYETRIFIDQGFEIDGTKVLWHSYRQPMFSKHEPILIVHYHGIRDYRLLFPAISTAGRAQRLANYYEEADKCFDSGAWLSFMLMCGAIFEGLLFDAIGNSSLQKFISLINKAAERELITNSEQKLIDIVRGYRNTVHLDNDEGRYVSRADVMDTRKVLDNIVERFSYRSDEPANEVET